jgi:hypothetical protein
VNWTPLSDWITAVGSITPFSITNITSGPSRLFRVQVQP